MSYNFWMELICVLLVLMLGLGTLKSNAFDECEQRHFSTKALQTFCK